jgi:uncharacterized protein YbjT (DUF2867 family)
MDVLVLGARGGLGRLVCGELETRGHAIRTVRAAGALAKVGAGAIGTMRRTVRS